VSTHKVDDPVKALGADTGISKTEVSRISTPRLGGRHRCPGRLMAQVDQRHPWKRDE